MTDALVSALVPYARFLECRARRLGVVTVLTPPDGPPTIDAAVVSSEPLADDNRPHVAVRVAAGRPNDVPLA